ncbi:MAG: class I SAM-dependent methyltransferase [Actinomycetota bacterium]
MASDTETRRDEFVNRIFESSVGMMDVLTLYMGDRLGLYRALAEAGPSTPGQMAERAGIHPRYAREWLEQQAATGILEVEDAAANEDERRYLLPDAHAEPLLDLDSPYSIAPLPRSIAAAAKALPKLLDAYRTGGGVEWEEYGADMIEAQGDFNRPWLKASLGNEYLPSIPDIHERLSSDPPARVADVACGVGWAAIAIAKAYHKPMVEGFDLDESSIELARGFAQEAGLVDRVRFEAMDAADPSLSSKFDLAVMIEALHDVSRPVDVLRAIKGMLAPGGTAVIADERVGDEFTAPGEDNERVFYGYSVLTCLPAAMGDPETRATGTVFRRSKLKAYATEAGFGSVEVLPIEHEFLRFYRLTP